MMGRSYYLAVDQEEISDLRNLKGGILMDVERRAQSRFAMFARYLVDLKVLLRLSYQHLNPSGFLGIVIGDPQIANIRVPLSDFLVELAKELGFTLKARPVEDRIRSRIQNFRLRNATEPIQRETLLLFARDDNGIAT